uniref:Uncharacterized protein n=1 Tax=Anguilla anguilla TaxID=7936 RepID=A0A0E9QBT2_ANGAN
MHVTSSSAEWEMRASVQP